jgi:xylulose-5-phosphate/fructose-6-phosphate phosphoketolase
MTVLNDIDRFHLVLDVLARVRGLGESREVQALGAYCHERRAAHRAYVTEHGEDMPEIRDWRWVGEG